MESGFIVVVDNGQDIKFLAPGLPGAVRLTSNKLLAWDYPTREAAQQVINRIPEGKRPAGMTVRLRSQSEPFGPR